MPRLNPHARGRSIAWFCVGLGLLISLYSVVRLFRGEGGALILFVGLPTVAYGVLMLRSVKLRRP